MLRNNKVDEHGTLYLGDGCWGQGARPVTSGLRWYEEKSGSIQHFWCVDVSQNRVEYRAINKEGKIFDVYPPDASGAKAAEEVFLSLPRPNPPPSGAPAKPAGKDD